MTEEQSNTTETKEVSSTTNNHAKIRPQITASIIVNLTSLSCGLCYCWADLHFNIHNEILEVNGVPIGAILGAVLSASLMNYIGRKWLLYVTNLPFIASWILLYIATDWPLVFAARLIAGLSIGSVLTTVPVYLSELVETRIRGATIGMLTLSFSLGSLIMSGISLAINRKYTTIIGLVPPGLYVLCAPWIPESPYYDLLRKKEKCAALSLAWLRRQTDNAEVINEIHELVESSNAGVIRKFYTMPKLRKALLIVLLLFAAQHLSGLLIIRSYAPYITKHLNFGSKTLVIMNAIAVLVAILSVLIVDRVGRKIILLISMYGNVLCLLLMGTYTLVIRYRILKKDIFYIPLAASVLHAIFYSLGLAPIPHIISSEVFPLHFKSWANGIAIIFASILAIIVENTCNRMIDAFDFHTVFLLYGVVELCIAIIANIIMFETKRKSFKEIQILLDKNRIGKVDRG